MSLVYEIVFLFLFVLVSGDGNGYQGEGECPSSFSCGYLGNISFPFTTTESKDCGLLPIHNCASDPNKVKLVQLQDKGKLFGVLRFNQFPKTCLFRDMDLYTLLQSRSCEAFTYNLTLPTTIFHFVSLRIETSQTLFRCNRTLHVNPPTSFHNFTKCRDYDLYYNVLISEGALGSCNMVQLPSKDVADAADPFTFITADISTEVNIADECANCHYNKGGQCQLDSNYRFYCYHKSKTGKKIPIAATGRGP